MKANNSKRSISTRFICEMKSLTSLGFAAPTHHFSRCSKSSGKKKAAALKIFTSTVGKDVFEAFSIFSLIRVVLKVFFSPSCPRGFRNCPHLPRK